MQSHELLREESRVQLIEILKVKYSRMSMKHKLDIKEHMDYFIEEFLWENRNHPAINDIGSDIAFVRSRMTDNAIGLETANLKTEPDSYHPGLFIPVTNKVVKHETKEHEKERRLSRG